MKKQFRFISIFLVLILCIFMFVACNSGTVSDKADSIPPDESLENGIVVDGISGSVNGSINSGISKPSTDNSNDNVTSEEEQSEFDTKIIKKYNLNTETKTFDVSIDAIEHLVDDTKGYIESSSINVGKSTPLIPFVFLFMIKSLINQ